MRYAILVTGSLLSLALMAPARGEDPGPASSQQERRERMQDMQRTMEQLYHATGRGERQKLMEEHMAQMRAFLDTMPGMTVGMMEGKGMMGQGGMMEQGGMTQGRGTGAAAPPTLESLEQQLNQLRERQEMIQVLLDQMLKQQQQQLKPGG